MRGCTLMWFTSERAKGRTSAMRGMGRSPATIAWRRARPLRVRNTSGGTGARAGRCSSPSPLRLRAALGRCRFAPPLELEGEDAAAERPSADVGLALQGVQHAPIVGEHVGREAMEVPALQSASRRVSLDTLLRAYTIEGATLNHRERDTGSLEVGKAADFIILDRDLFAIPPEDIGETRVLATFVEGVQVHAAAD